MLFNKPYSKTIKLDAFTAIFLNKNVTHVYEIKNFIIKIEKQFTSAILDDSNKNLKSDFLKTENGEKNYLGLNVNEIVKKKGKSEPQSEQLEINEMSRLEVNFESKKYLQKKNDSNQVDGLWHENLVENKKKQHLEKTKIHLTKQNLHFLKKNYLKILNIKEKIRFYHLVSFFSVFEKKKNITGNVNFLLTNVKKNIKNYFLANSNFKTQPRSYLANKTKNVWLVRLIITLNNVFVFVEKKMSNGQKKTILNASVGQLGFKNSKKNLFTSA